MSCHFSIQTLEIQCLQLAGITILQKFYIKKIGFLKIWSVHNSQDICCWCVGFGKSCNTWNLSEMYYLLIFCHNNISNLFVITWVPFIFFKKLKPSNNLKNSNQTSSVLTINSWLSPWEHVCKKRFSGLGFYWKWAYWKKGRLINWQIVTLI